MSIQPAGVLLGATAFLAIWFGHVAVRALEYRMNWMPWPLFAAAGAATLLAALGASSDLAAGALGIIGMTLLWDALEFPRQEKRVQRGHAPANPENPRHQRLTLAAAQSEDAS